MGSGEYTGTTLITTTELKDDKRSIFLIKVMCDFIVLY